MGLAKSFVGKYGIIEFENKEPGKIKQIVEKPSIEDAPSNIARLDRYILNSSIFGIIDTLEPSENGEYQITSDLLY